MKIDPHRNKDRYLRWKRNAQAEAAGISPKNFAIIMRFLSDMEQGLNVGTGGYLIQPEPWRVVPLGQVLRPKLDAGNNAGSCPWVFRLPVPGCVGVVPTGNEEDSPVKYATGYSGERVVPLLEARGARGLSPDGSTAATVGRDRRITILDLNQWWVPLTGSRKTPVPGAGT
jgi:hypothetical protein